MKKLYLLISILLLLTLTSCEQGDADQSFNANADQPSENSQIMDNKTDPDSSEKDSSNNGVADDPLESDRDSVETVGDATDGDQVTTDSNQEIPKERPTLTTAQNHAFEFDADKIAKAVDLGYPSPYQEIQSYNYEPSDLDVIGFHRGLQDVDLFNSLTHKGFDGIVTTYDNTQLMWRDFFGDLDYTDYTKALTITLKGESIYEFEQVDAYEKYHRYYDEREGIYYEISDLMMGNFTDENAELTQSLTGMSCVYKGLDGLMAPTHNPLLLDPSKESCLSCIITEVDGEPVIFFESQTGDTYTQSWVDIATGVLIKRIKFNSDGLPENIRTATSSVPQSVDQEVFVQPYTLTFTDITLLIYSLENKDKLKPLGEALISLLPDGEFSMTLTSPTGPSLDIHCGGFGESIRKPIYIYQTTDMNDQLVTLRQYNDEGRFVTICDEKEIVTKYATSSMEKKFFDFKKTAFTGVHEADDLTTYTFRNMDKGSVSGLMEFYEYQIDSTNNTLVKITVYYKEGLTSSDPIGETINYTITEFGTADESLFAFPDHYELIDYGDESHDDGEHMPLWYQ